MNELRAFGDHAERMHDSGYTPVPVLGKCPAVRRWNGSPMGVRAIRNLLTRTPALAGAGLALRTGKLVAIDIDEDDAIAAHQTMLMVFSVLGSTPFVRVGRHPRRVLIYRCDVEIESRRIGATEILGKGKLVVVAGLHPDTGKPYTWPEECLLDYDSERLPRVETARVDHLVQHLSLAVDQKKESERAHISSALHQVARQAAAPRLARGRASSGEVAVGERNNTLFLILKDKAVRSGSKAALARIADEVNASFRLPLPTREVESIVDSVWGYKTEGRLLVSGRQQIMLPIGKDDLLHLGADATYLLATLKATRTKSMFTIEQKSTARYLGWGSNRLKKAIDELVRHGTLVRVGAARRREAIRYRFAFTAA